MIVGVFDRKTVVFTSGIVSTYKKTAKPQNVLAIEDICCYNVDIVRVKRGVDSNIPFFISNIWDEGHRQ